MMAPNEREAWWAGYKAGLDEGRKRARAEGVRVALREGERLCGFVLPGESALEAVISWAGSVLTGIAIGLGIVWLWWGGGPSGIAILLAIGLWVVWGWSSLRAAEIRAKAMQRYWSPEHDENGDYIARVVPCGRVEIKARKGRAVGWRPAEEFGIVRAKLDAGGEGA